jgi:hypothetical protein
VKFNCHHCNHPNDFESRTCFSCGAPLPLTQPDPPPRRKRTSKKRKAPKRPYHPRDDDPIAS